MQIRPQPTVCIVTFGCQMNRHDSEVLAGILERAGFPLVGDEDSAEVVLFNTCSVREHAEERVLSRVSALRHRTGRGSPALIGIIGCMAERMGRSLLERAKGVGLVIGTGRLGEIPALILEALEPGGAPVVAVGEEGRRPVVSSAGAVRASPWEAYVAVIHGCNCRCAYCVVPAVRGREVSRPPAEVLRDVEELVAQGVTEVVLLGQNIDRYGKDLPGSPSLASLLRTLDGVRGLRRLRFVTSHPRDVTGELLEAVRDCPTVCEYLHAPAQSGASRILSAMGRGYDREGYLRMVERARRTVPGIAIASDFIAGFPGETEEDHAESVSLIREVEFQNGYFFKYSPRPGTRAAGMPDDVPDDVKRRRHAELLAAQDEVSSRRNAALVGSEVEILVEGVSRRDPDRVTGRSRTWRTCVLPKLYAAEPGSFVRARVTGSTALTLFCEAKG